MFQHYYDFNLQFEHILNDKQRKQKVIDRKKNKTSENIDIFK